jgi:cytochrome c-type biogenesis protein CcmE
MAKFIAKQTPFVGPSVRQLFNEPKSELAQKKADTDKRLKALGIIKPKKVSREKKLRELGLR